MAELPHNLYSLEFSCTNKVIILEEFKIIMRLNILFSFYTWSIQVYHAKNKHCGLKQLENKSKHKKQTFLQ